jgi:hypothetical protein
MVQQAGVGRATVMVGEFPSVVRIVPLTLLHDERIGRKDFPVRTEFNAGRTSIRPGTDAHRDPNVLLAD